MKFFVADNDLFDPSLNNLYVSLDSSTYKFKYRNFVDGSNGIFAINNQADEITYYHDVASKLQKSGFDGFKNWITEFLNTFGNNYFLDNSGKDIFYNALIFLTDDKNLKQYLTNIFCNFGFTMNELKCKKSSLF